MPLKFYFNPLSATSVRFQTVTVKKLFINIKLRSVQFLCSDSTPMNPIPNSEPHLPSQTAAQHPPESSAARRPGRRAPRAAALRAGAPASAPSTARPPCDAAGCPRGRDSGVHARHAASPPFAPPTGLRARRALPPFTSLRGGPPASAPGVPAKASGGAQAGGGPA